jgi:hypothetical protein
MDHVAYLNTKAKELENLSSGEKTMIIRGAMGRKMPYGRVNEQDTLYFIENNGDGLIKAKAAVKSVTNTDKLSKEESVKTVAEHQHLLMLNKALEKRFAGKRYLVLIHLEKFTLIEPFKIDRSQYGNMDDWLPVEDIELVKV